MNITDFIEARLRVYSGSPSPEMLQLLSALDGIARGHRQALNNQDDCAYDNVLWLCLTIRRVACAWTEHPDFDPEWDPDNVFGPYDDVLEVARNPGQAGGQGLDAQPQRPTRRRPPADAIRLRGPEEVSQHSTPKSKEPRDERRTVARGALRALPRHHRAHSREPLGP